MARRAPSAPPPSVYHLDERKRAGGVLMALLAERSECVLKWSASRRRGERPDRVVAVEVGSALVELELAGRAGRIQGGYVHEADAA
jgi:hypothetical protein